MFWLLENFTLKWRVTVFWLNRSFWHVLALNGRLKKFFVENNSNQWTYDSCRSDFAVFWLRFSLVRSISKDFGRRIGKSEADFDRFIIPDGELDIRNYILYIKRSAAVSRPHSKLHIRTYIDETCVSGVLFVSSLILNK